MILYSGDASAWEFPKPDIPRRNIRIIVIKVTGSQVLFKMSLYFSSG